MEEREDIQNSKKRIPQWAVVLCIVLCLAIAAGLMVYSYLHQEEGTVPDPKTPTSTPSVTPILNEEGNPAVIDAYVLDVGNGNCFIARSAEGLSLLVDAGHKKDFDRIETVLDLLGIDRIDVFVISRADNGHMGGAVSVLSKYEVGACYMTKQCAEDSSMQEVISAIQSRNIPLNLVEATFTSTIGWAENAELRILSPYDVTYESAKDYSLMLRLAYGASEILLASDANKVAERMVVKALPNRLIHSDVLVVSDHGDKDGTTEKFFSAVKPRIAIVSCSQSNPPDESVLARLNSACETVLLTKDSGNVHITLDGAIAQVVE